MANKYLNDTGLVYLISKIKTLLGGKVDTVAGKGLSSNDYTSEEKTKLSGIAEGANAYTHPSYSAKSSGMYKVTVDTSGHVSAATAVIKSDITTLGIPAQDTTYSNATTSVSGLMSNTDKSKLDAFGAASTYALKTDISGTYKYKGSVATESELPTTGQTAGDVYNIVAASAYGPAGQNVAWDGSAWDNLGGIFTIDVITTAEIDAAFV